MAKQGNIEQIFPLVGMNTDDDPRYFQEGDYLEALNLKIGSNQEQGDEVLVQTLKSTLLINLNDLDDLTVSDTEIGIDKLECLGKAIDLKNNIAYIFAYLEYFNYDDTGYDFVIWKYDLSDDSNKIILRKDANTWGVKGWDSDMLRIEAEVVDNKLVFTDYTNDIRLIDVNRIEVSTDNNIVTSELWTLGGAISGYSIDDIIYYQDKVYIVIQGTSGIPTLPTSAPTYYTELCNVIDCYLDTSDPNLFILAAQPPLQPPTIIYQSDVSTDFNKLKGSVWQFSYRYIYMDYRKSKYAQPSLIAEPNDEETYFGSPNTDISNNNRLRVSCSVRNEDIRALEIVGRSSADPATWFFLKKIYIVNDSGVKNYGINSTITFYFYDDQSKIPITLDEVYELFPYIPIRAKTISLVEGNILMFGNIQENYGLIDTDVSVSLAWETLTLEFLMNKYRALKKGITHKWGIIYRDVVGRITSVMAEDQMSLYVPFVTESTSSNVNRRPTVSFEINHVPHPDAVSYEIVKLGNSLNGGNTSQLKFWQLIGYNFSYGTLDHENANTLISDGTNYRLRIKKAQEITRNFFSNRWSVEEYVWEKGDRIRIIGTVGSTPGNLTELNNEIYDVEITGVYNDVDYRRSLSDDYTGLETETNEWIYFPIISTSSLSVTLSTTPPTYPDILYVEIYRPITSDSNLYFTTDMIFEIGIDGNGNKYHKGDTDQVLTALGAPSTPAIIQNTSHDIWIYFRDFRVEDNSLTYYLWAESDYPSDFYETEKMTSQGQPLIDINISGTGLLPERLRHGGILEVGTQINNIANFDFDDFKDLKVKDGPITKIVLVGFILKVVQEHKVVSIYISRLESFTAANNPTYTFTDNIFGTVRPFQEDWGSKHPGSIIVNDGILYYWNSKDGIIVENDYNGQVAISNNKMSRLFSDLAETLNAKSLQNQWIEFAISKDDFNNTELFCLFGTSENTKRIYVFNVRSKRWTYKIDTAFNYSRFIWLGKKLYNLAKEGSKLSVLYKWWSGANYQVISGDQRNGSLSIYSPNGDMRIFNTIVIYQDGATPQFTSVNIPKKHSATNREMTTYIYAVNIQEREGFYYCTILNDINTPGTGTQDDKLMNGDVLRGLLLNIVMSFTGNSKITLSNIEVITTLSKLKL